MAENKTKPTSVSVAAFVGALPESKRADAKAIIKLMQALTGERPRLWGSSIIGFGSYHYKYDSGREGDMPIIGFSPRKTATVLYLTAGFENAKADLAKLGKHKTGVGCLYINKLADVDTAVLERMLSSSVDALRTKYARKRSKATSSRSS